MKGSDGHIAHYTGVLLAVRQLTLLWCSACLSNWFLQGHRQDIKASVGIPPRQLAHYTRALLAERRFTHRGVCSGKWIWFASETDRIALPVIRITHSNTLRVYGRGARLPRL